MTSSEQKSAYFMCYGVNIEDLGTIFYVFEGVESDSDVNFVIWGKFYLVKLEWPKIQNSRIHRQMNSSNRASFT